MNIRRLRKCVKQGKYEISVHAEKERREEEIRFGDVEGVILTGEIIEEYPDDPRGPSCLLVGHSNGTPVHVVCGMLSNGWMRIITVYIPKMPKWISSTKRRSK